jgi:hypothetical protein
MHPDDYDWLFDPEYDCFCFACGRYMVRVNAHLWGGELYCNKCFEVLNQKEGYNGIYSTSETEF